MNVKIVVIAGLIFGIAAHKMQSAVLYTFSDSPGGVQLTYSGTLNTSGLSNQGGLGSTFKFIDISGVGGPGLIGPVLYEFENFQPSPLWPGQTGISTRYTADHISYSWNLTTAAQQYNASSAYGDTFGFYIYWYKDGYTIYLNPPFLYTSGTPINGGMFFAGQTLISMGLTADESFQILLPGNETVSGIVVVPEPQSVVLLVLAAVGILVMGRHDPNCHHEKVPVLRP